MSTFTIEVQDAPVKAALKALNDQIGNPDGALRVVGEQMVERIKRRFETSTGPDGQAWKPLSTVTLGLISERLGKSYHTKSGGLNARGERRLAGRKPLIDSGDLMKFHRWSVSGGTLTISNSQKYAALQNFGGKAGKNRKVTIPARPFLPVHADNTLYPQESALIVATIEAYINDKLSKI
ncbi:MAG TPA: phage virion morphogenesis protein [Burkholderiaceae bacterium]|nr:phage virion morphogenesis protein [Burkholderiaceae bacterium]